MSRNGNGVYTLPTPENPVVPGTTITTTWANTTLNNIADALTDSVAADGQTPMTGPLNMNNNKIENLATPTDNSDAATKEYVDNHVPPVDVTPAAVSDQFNTAHGYFSVPIGSTVQRPLSPSLGFIRGNTDTNLAEIFEAGKWVPLGSNEQFINIDYVVVAGGAGGANNGTGGGGAGGMLVSNATLSLTNSYGIIIGAGGASMTSGNNTIFQGITEATGGGAPGANGGSGGGGGGQGIAGQGYNGGNNVSGAGGGGGGAGQPGASATGSSSGGSGESNGGKGGDGLQVTITGSAVYHAGGGGGGKNVFAGPGGQGANGLGGGSTANRGGGGQGSVVNPGPGPDGQAGGSGVVYITYTGSPKYAGGTISTFGGRTIHTFNSSGTLSPLNEYEMDILVVGGGGSGGAGGGTGAYGGGGAGGVVYVTNFNNFVVGENYPIVVGAGGAYAPGAYESNSGNPSSAFGINALGGGGGTAKNGGSGGGANNGYGTGTVGQGNNGAGLSSGGAGGGGGGAGAAGSNQYGGGAGAGGIGLSFDITGTATYYGGGGGGGANADGDNFNGGGGGQGGGSSGANAYPGSDGRGGTAAANTGGGGGGGANVKDGSSSGQNGGGAGGSGVVILRYASPVQRGSGGTVTSYVDGSVTYWVHKFTSNGTYVA